MAHEIWIHPRDFVSTPREHVDIFFLENLSDLASLEEAAEL